MKALTSLLACPKCKKSFETVGEDLACSTCAVNFPILREIPRFVPRENYADSFGLQWNRFAKTQIDSALGSNRSRDRFLHETLWNESRLKGKMVLDAGCGSGRFSEIAIIQVQLMPRLQIYLPIVY